MEPRRHSLRNEQLNVLDAWYMIERFSPEPLPSPEVSGVVDWQGGRLPWEASGEGDRQLRHRCFLGCHPIADVYEELREVFADPSPAPRIAGVSACAVVEFDAAGRILPGTARLSAALWSVGRAHAPGVEDPTWLLGFGKAEKAFAERVAAFDARRAQADESDSAPASKGEPDGEAHGSGRKRAGPAHDSHSLAELVSIAHSAAGIDGVPRLAQPAVRIATIRDVEEDDPARDVLDNRLLGQILHVRSKVERGDIGTALWQFLAPDRAVGRKRRVDVREDLEAVDAQMSAERIPLGHWPGAGPLTGSQQFAVNRALHETRHHGILAINAPAEADRTAVVRDILAGNVVERARRLARLRDPEDAFTKDFHIWETGKPTPARHRVPQLVDELTGFEMVISHCASGHADEEIPRLSGDPGDADHAEAIAAGIRALSNRAADGSGWGQSCRRFLQAEERVEELRARRVEADGRRRAFARLPERQAELRQAIAAASSAMREAEASAISLRERLGRTERDLRDARAQLRVLDEGRPTAWSAARTAWESRREWKGRREELAQRIEGAALRTRTARESLEAAEGEARGHARRLSAAHRELQLLRESSVRLAAECEEDGRRLGMSYPTGAAPADPAPWLDEELDAARADLFFAALDLHKSFVASAKAYTEPGLEAAVDILTGDHPRDLDERKLLAVWQLFFLAVPFVSTTMASMDRIFGSLGREALGWLVVDGAESLAPQAAIGSLWRSRCVVVLGDSLRAEPAVAIPARTASNIAAMYAVDDAWLAPTASAQSLADRVSDFGTFLPAGSARWVGVPLRV